jgi:hypothetical protein
MTSPSSGTDFGDWVFKFCAKIINIFVIFILEIILEDQKVTSPLEISYSEQYPSGNFEDLHTWSRFQNLKKN